MGVCFEEEEDVGEEVALRFPAAIADRRGGLGMLLSLSTGALVSCGRRLVVTVADGDEESGLRRMHRLTCRLRFEFTPNRRPQI